MTVTELRELLEKEERKGHGDWEICVVSIDCEPIFEHGSKYTTDIGLYVDISDGTVTISD